MSLSLFAEALKRESYLEKKKTKKRYIEKLEAENELLRQTIIKMLKLASDGMDVAELEFEARKAGITSTVY